MEDVKMKDVKDTVNYRESQAAQWAEDFVANPSYVCPLCLADPANKYTLDDVLDHAEENFLIAIVATRGLFPGLTDAIDDFVRHRKLLAEVEDPEALVDNDLDAPGGSVSDRLLEKTAMYLLIWGVHLPELMDRAEAYASALRAVMEEDEAETDTNRTLN